MMIIPGIIKITWNPANVVNAGKTGASFKQNGNFKNIVYPDIFKNCDEVLVPGLGQYAFYPNRDSSAYATLYGLEEADTFIRTTLRHPDFCKRMVQYCQSRIDRRFNIARF
ncbi:saccharopine dehydrogenase C-terminal domain-containing protein [Niabella ginsengisoli]|uniref:saccharopine dehydrogenase C-terminal domain-containing protein n=1 Tax=Niabella ginsengisoli TaxID=522298 RepID=UPI0021D45E92|nr:saccharopine dehydrogenase C-terminal domain-containing protein [Niabella ginsengisoli]